MLTGEMKRLIRNHRAGFVATINKDGTPAVSPKATFVVVDDQTLAFGNIRSPGTIANVRTRPAVEVNFIDVLERKAVRVAGTAEVVGKTSASRQLLDVFEKDWPDYLQYMTSFVTIAIGKAELILSPAYDIGHTEEELRSQNLAKLNALA